MHMEAHLHQYGDHVMSINEVSFDQDFDVRVWLGFWDFIDNVLEGLELFGNLWLQNFIGLFGILSHLMSSGRVRRYDLIL